MNQDATKPPADPQESKSGMSDGRRSREDAAIPAPTNRWYHRIGPGLITACVVIGPGSITTSSQVGAKYGFSLNWMIVLAVALMMAFMTMGAKLGAVATESAGTLVAQRAGRWLAALIGVSVFFIAAAFQFGNNLGVYAAFQEFEEPLSRLPYLKITHLVVAFNALSIAFLFLFHNLYRAVERLMMAFVAVMLISFTVNLVFSRPAPGEFLVGFVPPVWKLFGEGESTGIDLSLLGLIGTTFVITAAYYQSYLVRQKGWGLREMANGLLDARVGSVIMALITIMLMSTAGAALRGVKIESAKDIAQGLTIFGSMGHAVFCIGLFSAAYSSFLVNSMIGGFILSDNLGLGSKPSDMVPRLATVAVLLIGMGVALYTISSGSKPMAAIVAGQAATVLASPLVAGTLLWLCNRRDVMGQHVNGWALNLGGGLGFLMLLAMAAYTAIYKVWPAIAG